MFTKKHFEAVAEIVRNAEALSTPKDLAEVFAELFAASNPRFNRSRFLEACGVDPS